MAILRHFQVTESPYFCQYLKIIAAENRDPRQELSRFLLQYLGGPHLTRGRSTTKMLYNRKIKTKLPSFGIHKVAEERAEIFRLHIERKLCQKKDFEKRKKAAPKPIKGLVKNSCLVRQNNSKATF